MSENHYTPGTRGQQDPDLAGPPSGDPSVGHRPAAYGPGASAAPSYATDTDVAPDTEVAPAAGNAPATAGPSGTPASVPPPGAGAPERTVTRAGVIWAGVVAALVLLILLIIFILQNQEQAMVQFLGFEGSVPLGMALFIAAVTGGVLVAVAGGARILQLRATAHRAKVRQRR